MSEKRKFTEILKLFDNKEYKSCKKECNKALEKTPDNIEIIALLGIAQANLGEKEEGLANIKKAIKMKFSNPIPWHFQAMYYKDEKDYEQSMKSYTMALKNDKDNFNVYREQSYLQLYLRYTQSFIETTRKCLELKQNLIVNWVTYSFANYLDKNYSFSEKIIDKGLEMIISHENKKKEDVFELKNFKIRLLLQQNKYKECFEYLKQNEKDFLDKIQFNENIYTCNFQLKEYSECIFILNKLIKSNPDNIEYFLNLVNCMMISEGTEKTTNSFTDLIQETDIEYLDKYSSLLEKIKIESDNEVKKSPVLYRLYLASLHGLKFEAELKIFLKQQIETTNTSVIVAIKWIYDYHNEKIVILDKVLEELSIIESEKETVFDSDLIPHIAWFHYIIAIHKYLTNQLWSALNYINKAIDTTPSVVEFFLIKGVILKRAFQFKLSEKSFEKAKKLDVGDRFLNAKHAKSALRGLDLESSLKIMQEFVKNPLDDENLDHIQTTWYMVEVASNHLKNGEIAQADRLLKSCINAFQSIFEDQFDFFNYCLRRNVITHLVDSLKYMDKVFDHKHLYRGLELLDILYEYTFELISKGSDDIDKEYLNLNQSVFKDSKYKFNSIKEINSNLKLDMIKIIAKLQPYSKNEHFHYISVKYALLNNKQLLAFKSLKYLFIHHEKNVYFNLSKELLANFLFKNQNEREKFKSILETNFPEFANIDKVLKETQIISTNYIEELNKEESKGGNFIDLRFSNKIKKVLPIIINRLLQKEVVIKFFENILSRELEILSQIDYQTYINLSIISKLYLGNDHNSKFNSALFEKFSKFSDPSVTIYNLDFYDIFDEKKNRKLRK